MASSDRLTIRNFAQIAEVDLTFADLTVLVGAQATGKSIALQWFKAALDGKHVVTALRDAGHATQKPDVLLDLIFGAGMGAAWQDDAEVQLNGSVVKPETLSRRGKSNERVFFIPAHRAMLISDGWASPFQRLSTDTPVVARIFSQNLFDRFSARGTGTLFPVTGVLKKAYRDQIDKAVFHGGTVGIEEDAIQHPTRSGSSQRLDIIDISRLLICPQVGYKDDASENGLGAAAAGPCLRGSVARGRPSIEGWSSWHAAQFKSPTNPRTRVVSRMR